MVKKGLRVKLPILRTLICLFLLTASSWAEQPKIRGDLYLTNLGLAKFEVKAYIESGQYQREFDEVVQQAKDYLTVNQAKYRGKKPSVVFDIDETSISNMPYLMENDFGYIPAPWQAWVQGDRAQPFASTLELYRWARANNISVFFVTARPESDREATLKLLARTGYSDIAGLYLKPTEDKASSAVYKAAQRRKITEQGYRVVVNLGDQLTDLDGGYAEASFKLPNPMYFVP